MVGKITENKSETFGFDAQTEQYVDMLSAGIVDPAKVVRVALQDRVGRESHDHDRGNGRGDAKEEGGSGHVGRRHGRYGRHGLLIS